MKWPVPDLPALMRRLDLPAGKIDMALDTDTYNEVDDQFALCYSLLSPERLEVRAIYAAPFWNGRSVGPGDGMEKSYTEILRLLGVLGVATEGFAYRGSAAFLPDGETPVESEAARDLVRRAMEYTPEHPLYVAAIGAITNVASALLMEPRIAERIVVVWLGGHPLSYPDTQEFNLAHDVPAARTVFDSGAAVVLIPCMGVASHLLTSVPEMEACIGGRNALCDTLLELFAAYSADHFAWGKEIWDISTIAYLVGQDWVPTVLAPSPLLTDDAHWAADARRHPIRVAYFVHRNPIFKDMYTKLGAARLPLGR